MLPRPDPPDSDSLSYYSAYVKFFKGLIAERGGLDGVIEEFITSPKANFQTNGESPDMLTRFLSGLVHPIIHACYGLEFGIPAIVAEGMSINAYCWISPSDSRPHLQVSP